MRVLVLDNGDWSTRKLERRLAALGASVSVWASDAIEVDEIREQAPERIVISHGPDTPAEAGISLPLIRELGIEIPILAVGLGQAAVVVAFGGRVPDAVAFPGDESVSVSHAGAGVFHGLPSPLEATCFDGSTVTRGALASVLEPTAWTEDGRLMGLRHRSLRVQSIQCYPRDAVLGDRLLHNFLRSGSLSQPA